MFKEIKIWKSAYQGFRMIQHFLSKLKSPYVLPGWMPLPAASLPLQWWYEMYVKNRVMVTCKKVDAAWLRFSNLSESFGVHLLNTLCLCVVWLVFHKWLHCIWDEQTQDSLVPIEYDRRLEVVWYSEKKVGNINACICNNNSNGMRLWK